MRVFVLQPKIPAEPVEKELLPRSAIDRTCAKLHSQIEDGFLDYVGVERLVEASDHGSPGMLTLDHPLTSGALTHPRVSQGVKRC
jgi:hypothetical protein